LLLEPKLLLLCLLYTSRSFKDSKDLSFI